MFHVVYHVQDPTPPRTTRAGRSTSGTWVFVLYLFGFVGLGGLHRIALGRPRVGLLYLMTLSLCGVGLIWDWFRLPALVASARTRD